MTTVAVLYSEFSDLGLEEEVLSPVGARVVKVESIESESGKAALAECGALMVTTQRVTAELLDRMPQCKLVSRVGTGLDSIDIAAATARGIWVTNVPDYSIDEVSTHAMAMLLAHARGLGILFAQAKERVWDQTTVRPLRRLAGQTLGVMGFGRIPRATAAKGLAMRLRVLAYDPYVEGGVMEAAGVEKADFETLLKESDYVTLHLPLTDETRHLLDAKALALMKPTAFLINAARGALVDEDALVEAVKNKRLAGAALDVFETEPLPAESALFHTEGIWITPHVAWYSEAAKVDMRTKGAEEVVRMVRGERLRNPVNQVTSGG